MPTKKKKSRAAIARHLHKRILIQLAMFVVISVVMFGVVTYDVIVNNLGIIWVLVGAIVGVLIGFIVGRAFKLNWHEDSQKIIMQIDRTGILIIGLYVAMRFITGEASHDLFSGAQLIVVTYSLLGGIMIGRIVSMWRRISLVLREQKII